MSTWVGSDVPREATLRAWLIGLVLAAVLGAANVYLGLKVGMTVSASIPAAVVGMLLLRRVLRGGSVLEANLVQTAASAGESLAAGILFTVPALLLIGHWDRFDYWTTTLIAIAGGWLGVLFMIPMRRIFIEDRPDLPFPEGVACASVLRAGSESASPESARAVVAGGLLGGVVKLVVGWLGLASGMLEGAVAIAGRPLAFGAELSPALVAVGAIVRLEVAAQVFLGGALAWWVVLPAMPELVPLLAPDSSVLREALLADSAGSASERASLLWSQGVRHVGVGAMAVGGLAALVRARSGLARALAELRADWRRRAGRGSEALVGVSSGGPGQASSVDLAPGVIAGLAALALATTAGLYFSFTGALSITLLATLVMAVMAFFFVGVASSIVGLVGNSNSPVSGMTITAVLCTGVVLLLAGYTGMQGMVATLGVAAVVCCAACTAGDICNDLKTGSLVGASPRSQQRIQLAGVVVAALVLAPVLQLLDDAYGIGSRELAAPQASLFASLARGFFGDEVLPWGLVGIGALLGLTVLAGDRLLARRRAAFRLHLMPIAVGMYLPIGLSLPMLAGGWVAGRVAGRAASRGPLGVAGGRAAVAQADAGGSIVERGATGVTDTGAQRGVLFASGAVAGEALVGVAVAAGIGLGFEPRGWGGSAEPWLAWPLAFGVILAFRAAVRSDEAKPPR